MAIQVIRTAASLAPPAITCRASGMWQALRAHIEGRNAVHFERERRATLLTVPPVLPPGTEMEDLRADGSVLRVRVPPAIRMDAVFQGHTERSTPQIALPAAAPPGRDSTAGHANPVQTTDDE